MAPAATSTTSAARFTRLLDRWRGPIFPGWWAVLLGAVLYVLAQLGVEALQGLVDPRVR